MKPVISGDMHHRAFEDERGAELATTLRTIATELVHRQPLEDFAIRLHDSNRAPVGAVGVEL